MAKLRAYCSSGGQVTPEHLNKTEARYKVTKKVMAKATKAFKSAGIEKLGNIPLLRQGKNVPYFKQLKAIAASMSII